MNPGHMISYQDKGRRMLGRAGRRSGAGAYMGQMFRSDTSFVQPPPASSYGGELGPTAPTVQAAPSPAPAPQPAPIVPARSAPVVSIAQSQCPACPSCTGKVVAAGVAGVAVGSLLMWVVGMLTKEAKKRKKKRAG